MRKRDIKIGMAVKHARSGKPLGKVTRITNALIYLDGECPIATPAEITPDNVECRTCGGKRWVAVPSGNYPCPDCTPEIVECLRCTCPDYPGVEWHDYGCPLRPSTPENVEEPT